jgi:uncharacterized protein (TIGR00369 family)
MHPLNQNYLIQKYNESNSFGDLLGIHFEILDKGKVNYFAKIKKEHLATIRAVHGGLLATLCDGALGIAALSCVVENQQVVATIEMKINYLKPVFEGDELIAQANVISAGKRLIVSECKVYNQSKELICIASGTFNAYPKEKAGY